MALHAVGPTVSDMPTLNRSHLHPIFDSGTRLGQERFGVCGYEHTPKATSSSHKLMIQKGPMAFDGSESETNYTIQ